MYNPMPRNWTISLKNHNLPHLSQNCPLPIKEVKFVRNITTRKTRDPYAFTAEFSQTRLEELIATIYYIFHKIEKKKNSKLREAE